MAIQTRGFGVDVMPQAPVIDPRLFAIDPNRITQGAMQAFQLLSAADQIKAQRALQAEQNETRGARIANTKALSDINVLNRDNLRTVSPAKTQAELAGFDLSAAQSLGALGTLPAEQELAGLTRQVNTKAAKSKLLNMDTDAEIARLGQEAETEKNLAMAANYRAEAARYNAMAKAAGVPDDKLLEAWEKGVGEAAATMGMTPKKVRDLYQSGAVNEFGVPISAEFAALSELIKKPEFFLDPYDGTISGGEKGPKKRVSQALQEWMGGDALQVMATKGMKQKAASGGKTKEGEAAGPIKIKVDAKGNVQRPKDSKEPEPLAIEEAQDSTGITPGQIATGAALTGLGLATRPGIAKTLGNIAQGAAKVGQRAWEGRSAAGQFTGRALKTLPQRSAGQLAKMGVGAAALPVTALSLGNEALGAGLSDRFTGDLSAIEGIAMGANADSFDTSAQEAKFDELSQRIRMTVGSTKLNPTQKMQELEALLNERDMLWSAMNQGIPQEEFRPADYR